MTDADEERRFWRRETRRQAAQRIMEGLDLDRALATPPRQLPPMPKAEEQFPDDFHLEFGPRPLSRSLLFRLGFKVDHEGYLYHPLAKAGVTNAPGE